MAVIKISILRTPSVRSSYTVLSHLVHRPPLSTCISYSITLLITVIVITYSITNLLMVIVVGGRLVVGAYANTVFDKNRLIIVVIEIRIIIELCIMPIGRCRAWCLVWRVRVRCSRGPWTHALRCKLVMPVMARGHRRLQPRSHVMAEAQGTRPATTWRIRTTLRHVRHPRRSRG